MSFDLFRIQIRLSGGLLGEYQPFHHARAAMEKDDESSSPDRGGEGNFFDFERDLQQNGINIDSQCSLIRFPAQSLLRERCLNCPSPS